MWKTKKIAVSQPFFVIFAHLTAIFENFWSPGGVMGGHVKKIFLLKCAENYFRHTKQNSEAFKKPFFCYKKFLFSQTQSNNKSDLTNSLRNFYVKLILFKTRDQYETGAFYRVFAWTFFGWSMQNLQVPI